MEVLDTTVLVDLVRGKSKVKKLLSGKSVFVTTQICMYELIEGFFYSDASPKKILQIKELFENIRVLPLNDDAIIRAGSIAADLNKNGQTVPDCDCLIAGTALAYGITTIVTNNTRHFKRIKELKVIPH